MKEPGLMTERQLEAHCRMLYKRFMAGHYGPTQIETSFYAYRKQQRPYWKELRLRKQQKAREEEAYGHKRDGEGDLDDE